MITVRGRFGGLYSAPMSSSSAGVAAGTRVPDFFIVGHPKSGTTALYDMLGEHPQVFMPANKEPWYLSEEVRASPSPRQTGWTPPTLASYLELFAPAGPERVAGEASALLSLVARRRARDRRAAVPTRRSSRSCASRRASCARCTSSSCRCTSSRRRTSPRRSRSSRRAASAARASTPTGRARRCTPSFVRYVEQLRRFHDCFDRERVLVLIYDDYRRDNEATLRELQRFLGVDDEIPVRVRESNPSVEVRSQRLHQLVHAVSVGEGASHRVVRGPSRRSRRRGSTGNRRSRSATGSSSPRRAAVDEG